VKRFWNRSILNPGLCGSFSPWDLFRYLSFCRFSPPRLLRHRIPSHLKGLLGCLLLSHRCRLNRWGDILSGDAPSLLNSPNRVEARRLTTHRVSWIFFSGMFWPITFLCSLGDRVRDSGFGPKSLGSSQPESSQRQGMPWKMYCSTLDILTPPRVSQTREFSGDRTWYGDLLVASFERSFRRESTSTSGAVPDGPCSTPWLCFL